MIEGGQDPSQAAAYHPFYITDDPEGGYEFMTEARKRKVSTFKKRQHYWLYMRKIWASYINFMEYIIFLIYIRFKCSQEYKAIDKEVLNQLVREGSANGKKILQSPQVVRAHSGRIKGLFLYSVNKGSQESYSGHRMQIRQI